ncbi:hypothetical protein SUGI_0776200 [Cryptomeria japonica]|nr:hypothetical protein SUGI_0776200 [Cryptomeria japonica]
MARGSQDVWEKQKNGVGGGSRFRDCACEPPYLSLDWKDLSFLLPQVVSVNNLFKLWKRVKMSFQESIKNHSFYQLLLD